MSAASELLCAAAATAVLGGLVQILAGPAIEALLFIIGD